MYWSVTGCGAAVEKADAILGCIRRGVSRRQGSVSAIIQGTGEAHLRRPVQFWAPVFKKDEVRLEQVQSRAVRVIGGTENLLSERRLKSSACLAEPSEG